MTPTPPKTPVTHASRIDTTMVPESGTLRDALVVIDVGSIGIAFVVDAAKRLVGTLSDGDVRRAILKGAGLDEPLRAHVHRSFTSVTTQASRSEVLDMMQARAIEQVPVVDGAGQLVGVHVLRELIGAVERSTWAVIMAGGRGVRLRPITDTMPKPMIKVAGRPILERIVLHLVGFGIQRVFLSVNYKAEMIEDHFGDGARFGCNISYLRETTPLGTAGALSLLPEAPREPLLVLNGDLLTQLHVGDMLDFHAAGTPAAGAQGGPHAATVAVTQYSHTVPFGVVELDGDRIGDMIEKPTQQWWTNAGIYCLSPDVVARVKPNEETPMTSLIGDCITRKESVGAFRIMGDWIDVGRPDELKRARGEGGAE
jgi:dTDP-glucose pyrophosphorylase/CBS domain-containing protein